VVTVSTGAAALAQVARRLPNVVLLAVQLPLMSGWEVFQQLRERNVPVPVVFLGSTGLAGLRARMEGAAGFVGKPVEVGHLVRTIRPFMTTAVSG
jgi:CheY-like chemotaxis protein